MESKYSSGICIILSTYNGERYLREQIDSILCQDTPLPVSFFVRDDGSSDETKNILRSYMEKGVSIRLMEGENKGPAASFMEAVCCCPEAAYYAFCDQDDVWLPEKLRIATEEIGQTDIPVLWASSFSLCNSVGKVTRKNGLQDPCLQAVRVLYYNDIPGCVMVFNDALLKKLRALPVIHVRMHDITALSAALLTGKVIFNSDPLVLYRQHTDNAIGYGHKKFQPLKWLKDKWRLLFEGEAYSMADLAKAFLDIFDTQLNVEDKELLCLIEASRSSFSKRLRLLRQPCTKAPFGRTSLSIRAKIFFGII